MATAHVSSAIWSQSSPLTGALTVFYSAINGSGGDDEMRAGLAHYWAELPGLP
jgi:hypothetical protein